MIRSIIHFFFSITGFFNNNYSLEVNGYKKWILPINE